MHPQSSSVQLTVLPVGALVLEQLPNGEWAWLRPEMERISRTNVGRRVVALEAPLGLPWPPAAEPSAS